MSVGSQLVLVEVKATGTLLRLAGPHTTKPVSFEGRLSLSWRDRLVNWLRLIVTSRSPLRCAFADVHLAQSEDGAMLTVNPDWPWDSPLQVRTRSDDCGILDEWKRASLNHLDGKSVLCNVIENGFAILDARSGTVLVTIRWDAIQAIRAFKRDLFAYDMICLAFQLPDESWVEIWEESEGFIAVIEKMHQVLPGIPENWCMDIMVPVFETMDTLLYRRDDERNC